MRPAQAPPAAPPGSAVASTHRAYLPNDRPGPGSGPKPGRQGAGLPPEPGRPGAARVGRRELRNSGLGPPLTSDQARPDQ